jgi:hypothetical protein
MLGIIIAAVLGAAVGALTTASLKWGRSALAIVSAHIRRDHRTLYGGRAWALPQYVSAGGPCSVRVLVACAPSRAIRRSDIAPDRAIPFIRESFPGMFPDEPSLSLPQEGVKFTIASQGSPNDGYAWAWQVAVLTWLSISSLTAGLISGSSSLWRMCSVRSR